MAFKEGEYRYATACSLSFVNMRTGSVSVRLLFVLGLTAGHSQQSSSPRLVVKRERAPQETKIVLCQWWRSIPGHHYSSYLLQKKVKWDRNPLRVHELRFGIVGLGQYRPWVISTLPEHLTLANSFPLSSHNESSEVLQTTALEGNALNQRLAASFTSTLFPCGRVTLLLCQ